MERDYWQISFATGNFSSALNALQRRKFVLLMFLLFLEESSFQKLLCQFASTHAKGEGQAKHQPAEGNGKSYQDRSLSDAELFESHGDGKNTMMVRITVARTRGEGESALTAASSAARAKKLAATNPKKTMNSAANNRGRKRKNLEMYSCKPDNAEHLHSQQDESQPYYPKHNPAQQFTGGGQGQFIQQFSRASVVRRGGRTSLRAEFPAARP